MSVDDSSSSNSSLVAAPAFASYGSDRCPCLPLDGFKIENEYSVKFINTYDEALMNLTEYGFGCKAHDLGTLLCTPAPSDPACDEIVPRPLSCGRDWCEQQWCYVNASDCRLLHDRSEKIQTINMYYSYATCGDMDRFVNEERINRLEGQTYQVGYLSSMGGWKGTYNSNGLVNFARAGWSGPLVKFFETAAFIGEFSINRTEPPLYLEEKATEFWTNSSFDFCAYAAILGYLDFCVGTFTITSERAAAGTFFPLYSEALYLITLKDKKVGWNEFWNNVDNVFMPFTRNTWFLILFGVIPIMSLLMTLHERRSESNDDDSPGRPSLAVTRLKECGETFHSAVEWHEPRLEKIKRKTYRFIGITCDSLFQGYNAFLTGAYEMKGTSTGGRLTVIGLGFFILAIITSYTANLAALLTNIAQTSDIKSLEDAINAGYNFCGERKAVSAVMDIYNLENLFVPDPEDGEPAFNCMTCNSRERALNFIKSDHNDRSLYCNAAIATIEDLQDLQSQGLHCNKTVIGLPLGYSDYGIPIYEGISEEMTALLQDLKNDGTYDRILAANKPAAQCANDNSESVQLTIVHLTGVWTVTFGFAVAGLIALLIEMCIERRQKRQSSISTRRTTSRSTRRY